MACNSEFFNSAKEMQQKLSTVSPSFCLAKWLQVTMHLQNGHTHSCHHPVTHLVPPSELKDNPSALHNTEFKKQQRKQMLEGKRPKECQYCWNIEDSGTSLSDRHFKSGEPWAKPRLDDVAGLKWDTDIPPSYLEVSFSNQCNFQCSYCSPQVSSRWTKDIKDNGPFKLNGGMVHHDLSYLKNNKLMPYASEEENPYVEAFWKWWPDLLPHLKVLRLTGGEPLLSPSTFRVLDELIASPQRHLSLAINSNLGVAPATFEKFKSKLAQINGDRLVQDLTVYTSVDGSGAQAEYIRSGLNYQALINNIHELFRDVPRVRVVIMCTYNILSVYSFRGLLEQMLAFRAQYSDMVARRIWLDISYLRYPDWQSVQILNAGMLERMRSDLEFMRSHDETPQTINRGFQDAETEKMTRLLAWAQTGVKPDWLTSSRKNFYSFFSEYDRRKQTDFLSTFPEMQDLWTECRRMVEGDGAVESFY